MKKLDEIIRRVKKLSEDQQTEILEILKSWQPADQRFYQRIEQPMEIDVLIGDSLSQTVLKNVSATGVLFKPMGKIDEDQDVRVVFSVPGTQKPFKLDGHVVRFDQDGLAVEFKKVTPYLLQILDDAIQRSKDVAKKPTKKL